MNLGSRDKAALQDVWGGMSDRLLHLRLSYKGVINVWPSPCLGPQRALGQRVRSLVMRLQVEKLYPPQIKGHCLGEEHHKGEEEWPLVLLTPIGAARCFACKVIALAAKQPVKTARGEIPKS